MTTAPRTSPRILVAHPFPDVYGADRVLLDAVIALRDAGPQPTVVLPEPGPMVGWLDKDEIPVRCVATPVLRRALLRPSALVGLARTSRRDFALIRKTITELDPHVIYVNTVTLPHWMLAARRAGLPLVVHVHESDDRLHPVIAAGLVSPLLAADRIIAVSEATKAFLCRSIPRLRGRISIVYNGVAPPAREFPPPLGHATRRLALVGRLSANKGQDLAIAAVDSLVSRGHDVRLNIVGSIFAGAESYEAALHRSVHERGLGGRVSFSGFCPDVWKPLSQADIVVAPSRTDSLPLVVIEAMLAGRPVVAADVGGMRELIDDGHSGLLVTSDDVPDLTEKLLMVLNDPELARRLGANAKVAAEQRFSRDRFRREIVETVEAVRHR